MLNTTNDKKGEKITLVKGEKKSYPYIKSQKLVYKKTIVKPAKIWENSCLKSVHEKN